MIRSLAAFALIAIATPAFAAEPVETITVRYESTYVNGVAKQVRNRQSTRRSKLSTLKAKRVATLVAVMERAALLERATQLPIATEAAAVAVK